MTIEEITLDNNIILNYEFIHDNKSDKDVITNKVFDMINRQMLLCNKKISNPEVIMKESLFKNIKYNNVSITDTIYTDTLVTQDNMKMKKDIFLVFDNNQLTLSNIEIMKLIFENKNMVIFIPFIFLAEYLLGDKIKEKTIKEVKDKFKNDFKDVNIPILFDNYVEDEDKLSSFYKTECEDIGLYYNGINDELINFNIFSKKYLGKEKILSGVKKIKFMEEIKKVKKYLDNFNYVKTIDKKDTIKKEFFDEMQKVKDKFNNTFIDIISNKIKNITNVNNKFYEKIEIIRKLIMSLKESRDTYYYNEIKNYLSKNKIYTTYQIFYITLDEISNVRCILNKISTINIYNGIPRYIISIYNNNIIFKHFNIFHKFIDETTNLDIKKQVEKTRKYNINLISNSGKSLFLKRYKLNEVLAGGLIYNNHIKNDYITYYTHIKDKEILTTYKMDIKESIDKRDYNKIGDYIYESDNIFESGFDLLLDVDNQIIIVQEITKGNIIYINKIKELNEMFSVFKYLYNNIPCIDLLKNIHHDMTYDEIINENICTTKYDLKNSFATKLNSIFEDDYDRYKRHFKKEIPLDKWDGLYIVWLFSRCIHNMHLHEYMKLIEFVFPDLIKDYPFEDMFNLLTIRNAIIEQLKAKRRETVEDYCSDDNENYFYDSDDYHYP